MISEEEGAFNGCRAKSKKLCQRHWYAIKDLF
ncbi:hypothetical protein F0726_02831 [Acidithiobacillus caldus]|nr:hypothetical protein F0726_02831 [Acidithiobacillus caldus]